MSDTRSHKTPTRGVTLIELLFLVAIVLVALVLSVPFAARSLQSAAINRLADDGKSLFEAIVRYQSDHGHPPYPGSAEDEGLNLRTLAPLTTAGYFRNAEALLSRLSDHRLLAYDTPGLPGREGFWMILVDAQRPEIQVLVASTDQFPLTPDSFLEGIYLIRGMSLEKLDDAPVPVPQPSSQDGSQHG